VPRPAVYKLVLGSIGAVADDPCRPRARKPRHFYQLFKLAVLMSTRASAAGALEYATGYGDCKAIAVWHGASAHPSVQARKTKPFVDFMRLFSCV